MYICRFPTLCALTIMVWFQVSQTNRKLAYAIADIIQQFEILYGDPEEPTKVTVWAEQVVRRRYPQLPTDCSPDSHPTTLWITALAQNIKWASRSENLVGGWAQYSSIESVMKWNLWTILRCNLRWTGPKLNLRTVLKRNLWIRGGSLALQNGLPVQPLLGLFLDSATACTFEVADKN